MVKYKIDGNHVEIYFETIPNETIRKTLKICGWHWVGTKKCWSNFKNEDNIMWAKVLCEDINPKDESQLEVLDRYNFTVENLVVRKNSFFCNCHHDVKDAAGIIEVCNGHGNIETFLVPIACCETCGLFYILEETYQILKKRGVIMCQIMSYKKYLEHGTYDDDFQKWKTQSPLKIWGYTVSQVEEYTDAQRHAMLEDIIDCCVMTKDRILTYLDFFIRLNRSKGDRAVEKWTEDRDYISRYVLGTAKRVRIGKITIVDREYR